MVYYRKYRPQLISELDLTSVREKLTFILSAKDIPHAFLFAGPKGLGKTSSARILAKAINCEKRLTTNKSQLTTNKTRGKLDVSSQKLAVNSVEPCNVCSACVSITNGSAVDVLEIDAASNRGIDEIRDLKERIKFSPSQLRKKIYIIDEVHMLTAEAFNALLKTLEEPPEHVVFILATTEIGKLPGTILSRVFLVRFEKPGKEEIARSLKRVARGENLEVDEKALEKIGELSDGAFRDGAKILEELSLHTKGKKITLDLLETLYKTGSIDNSVEKLVELTLGKKVKDALEVIESLAQINSDFKQVIEKMADALHIKLLDLVLNNKTDELPPIQKLLELLDEAYKGLKGAVLPQLPLEIAILEYSLEAPITKSQITDNNQIQNIKSQTQTPTPILHSGDERSEDSKIKPDSGQAGMTTGAASSQAPRNDIQKSNIQGQGLVPNLDLFKQLVESVNSENKILAGLLRGCKIEESGNGKIILKAPSTFHLGKLTERQNNIIVQAHLAKILQKEVALEIKN